MREKIEKLLIKKQPDISAKDWVKIFLNRRRSLEPEKPIKRKGAL